MLDNCEHVITTAAEVAEDLLRRCPALRILATSREGLRVGGETRLARAAARGRRRGAPLRRTCAGRRRAARALRRRPRGDRRHLRRASTDCRSRSSSAAARTRAFPIAQIASRLNDRFRLLTGGSRTALPRQQTLRAVVDWSYELLFDDEQRVFERLSVFPGGCDLATAEVVCADDVIAAADLADHLHALVDKSLVVAVPSGDATAVHATPDARAIRQGEAHRTRRRGAYPRRDGAALRTSSARRAPPRSRAIASGRG